MIPRKSVQLYTGRNTLHASCPKNIYSWPQTVVGCFFGGGGLKKTMQAKKINIPAVHDLTKVWSREGGGKKILHPFQSYSKRSTSLNFLFPDLQPKGVMLRYRLVLMQSNYSHFHFFPTRSLSLSPSPPSLCLFPHFPSSLHFFPSLLPGGFKKVTRGTEEGREKNGV